MSLKNDLISEILSLKINLHQLGLLKISNDPLRNYAKIDLKKIDDNDNKLSEEDIYNYKLIDNNIFRFEYELKNNDFYKARLEFVCSRIGDSYFDEIAEKLTDFELELLLEKFGNDLIEFREKAAYCFFLKKLKNSNLASKVKYLRTKNINSSFKIRLDYDKTINKKNHPQCHLTVNDFEYSRFPINRPISPKEFVDFIFRLIYGVELKINYKISFNSNVHCNYKAFKYKSIISWN